MLLSKITQLVYCSLPHVPIVLQSIVLDYYGSFYEVELIEYMGDFQMNDPLWNDWNKLVPVVREEYVYEQYETLYTRLEESIKLVHYTETRNFWGATGPTGVAGATGCFGYDGRKPFLVSVEDAKLFFIYHPQLKDALIYHEALDSFLIPYKYSTLQFLSEFFHKLNMFVALPQNPSRGASFHVAISLT